MPNNNLYLYTVYRNSDDRLLALDVPSREAARIMKMNTKSFHKLMWMKQGRNVRWTVIKNSKKEIEEDMNELHD